MQKVPLSKSNNKCKKNFSKIVLLIFFNKIFVYPRPQPSPGSATALNYPNIIREASKSENNIFMTK